MGGVVPLRGKREADKEAESKLWVAQVWSPRPPKHRGGTFMFLCVQKNLPVFRRVSLSRCNMILGFFWGGAIPFNSEAVVAEPGHAVAALLTANLCPSSSSRCCSSVRKWWFPRRSWPSFARL